MTPRTGIGASSLALTLLLALAGASNAGDVDAGTAIGFPLARSVEPACVSLLARSVEPPAVSLLARSVEPATAVTSVDGSPLAIELPRFEPTLAARTPSTDASSKAVTALTGERAAILLRSLTLPGWGQATVGHTGAAKAFGIAEFAVWASFTAFRVQGALRKEAYESTANLLAGIDLNGRDEEFRRIVGSYRSSEEYNLLVVFRDAANLYYDDPVQYRAYIAEHSLKESDHWSWNSDESLLRYRGQRKDAQRASLRANTALAVAVVNRVLSAVHAARAAGHPRNTSRSWNFEAAPADANDATAFRFGVRTRF